MRKQLPLYALTICVLLAIASAVTFSLRTDWHRKTIVVNGVNRSYLFYAPNEISGELPLLLVFHGFSGNADRIRRSSKLHEMVNEHNFYLAYLDGDPTWHRPTANRECVDIDFVDALCDSIAESHSVDKNRIYAAGMSMGGAFAIRLGAARSNKIAAVVSQGMLVEDAIDSERPFPLMVIVGTKDDRVPSAWFPKVPDAFRALGHEVHVVRPQGVGHRWHVALNNELWSFLSKHRLNPINNEE